MPRLTLQRDTDLHDSSDRDILDPYQAVII
jgi:hypothetical protein